MQMPEMPEQDEDARFRELLDRSSLGTPEAKALRESVTDETAAKIVARSKELRARAEGAAEVRAAVELFALRLDRGDSIDRRLALDLRAAISPEGVAAYNEKIDAVLDYVTNKETFRMVIETTEQQDNLIALAVKSAKAEALTLEESDRLVEHLLNDGTRDGLFLSDLVNTRFGRSARRRAAAIRGEKS